MIASARVAIYCEDWGTDHGVWGMKVLQQGPEAGGSLGTKSPKAKN